MNRSNCTWNKMNFPRNFEFNLINVWLWHNLFDGLANWTILLFHTNEVWVCIATRTIHVVCHSTMVPIKMLGDAFSRLINVIQANIVQVSRKLCREYVDNGQMKAMMLIDSRCYRTVRHSPSNIWMSAKCSDVVVVNQI